LLKYLRLKADLQNHHTFKIQIVSLASSTSFTVTIVNQLLLFMTRSYSTHVIQSNKHKNKNYEKEQDIMMI